MGADAPRGIAVLDVGSTNTKLLLFDAGLRLVAEEKAFRGSLMGSCVPERDIPRYVRMFLDGKLPVDRLKSGAMGFEALNDNLDLLDSGAVLRQILLPHG